MMGVHEKQNELWVEPVNLGRRIPAEHLLRRLQQVLDLSFVRGEVSACYGANGNVSVDPVIIMKMMLLLFLDDVRSERELLRIIPLRIDYLWFLGYGLEDEVPHHSVLSKARQRWGTEVFERLFATTIEQCVTAGLVAGDKLHVDSSLVKANASRAAVAAVVSVQMAKLEPVNEQYVNTTDPDSTVTRYTKGKPTPRYKNHRVLDDHTGVITAMQSTTGIVDDGEPLVALVKQHEQRTGKRAQTVVADAKYGTTANFLTLQQQGKTTHMGDLRDKLINPRSQGIYPAEQFTYDAQADHYTCPAGELIKHHHFHARRGYDEYRPAKGTCTHCPHRVQCTRDQAGRSLKRYRGQELIDQGRAQSHSEAGQKDRKRRQWFQERNFAEATTQHGFKTARWRRLWRQTIQDYLIAAIQNLKILIRHTLCPIQKIAKWCNPASLFTQNRQAEPEMFYELMLLA